MTTASASRRALIVIDVRPDGGVLADAAGAVSYRNAAGYADAQDIHRAFCVVLHARFAAAVTTDAWTAAVRRAEALPRGSIVDSHAAAQPRTAVAVH